MVVSPKEDYIYLSVRPTCSDNEEIEGPPETYTCWGSPSKNKVIRTIDIRRLEFKDSTKYNHILRENPPSYLRQRDSALRSEINFDHVPIMEAVSDNFLASVLNSELHIWDLRYGILLKKMSLYNRIEAVKFNPNDEQECVTLSESSLGSQSLKLEVWKSKEKIKQKHRVASQM